MMTTNISSRHRTVASVMLWQAGQQRGQLPTLVVQWLSVGLLIERFAGSTPGRGAIKSARSTQPSTLNFSLSEDFILVGKLSQKKSIDRKRIFKLKFRKPGWTDQS